MTFPQIARYAALGPSLWSFDRLPPGTTVEPAPITAPDGGESAGTLYTRGGETTVVCMMHPRGDMQRHYAIPALLEGGFACWAQAGRAVNNDINLIHETLLADIAGSMKFLKDRRGFERVVLLGNSGGGALYTFYLAQALTDPPGRLTKTPAGDPYDFNQFDMPAADGIIHLATHLGQGKLMLTIIDPSVTDEKDPLSIDPSLDMYNPANGYKPLPEPSKYSDEFLTRYRDAQRARVARIDAIARGYIAEQNHYRAQIVGEDFDALPADRQQWALRRGLAGRYMEVHRTEANPAYTDLSLYASDRAIGSFFSPRPDLLNYTEAGFGKYQTPRAWLSTWSGLSSNASTLDCLPKVTLPTLVIAYTGDNAVFSCDTDAVFEQLPAADKEMHRITGDHLGYGPSGVCDTSGREAALGVIVKWIRDRF